MSNNRDGPGSIPTQFSPSDLKLLMDAVPLARFQLAHIAERLAKLMGSKTGEVNRTSRRLLSRVDSFGRGMAQAQIRGVPVQNSWKMISWLVLLLGYAAAEAKRQPELTNRRPRQFAEFLERISGGSAGISCA